MDSLLPVFRGLLGLLVMVALGYALSENRRSIRWRLVLTALVLQFILAGLVLHVGVIRSAVEVLGNTFVKLLDFTQEGTRFMFGSLLDNERHGLIFAFAVLPSVIFFSAFSAALYYLGILQRLVHAFAWLMSRTMRLSGAESLSASANVFLGQTEAPLLIRPYLERMTRSEIMCVMVGGMATIGGAVMIAYITLLGGADDASRTFFATHLITASVISAPAAILFAKMLVPETEDINTDLSIAQERIGTNLIEAICIGTADGLKLAVNIGAMLIVFTAFIALVNFLLIHGVGGPTHLNTWVASVTDGTYTTFSLEFIIGVLCAPFAWLIGVSEGNWLQAGQLLGTRTVLNEFVAYVQLAGMKEAGAISHPRDIVLLTYALCGFANFASIGIQVGGIGAMAPSQRPRLAQLGLRAVVGGTLACFSTACVAGILL